jgi:hypothetical protein
MHIDLIFQSFHRLGVARSITARNGRPTHPDSYTHPGLEGLNDHTHVRCFYSQSDGALRSQPWCPPYSQPW